MKRKLHHYFKGLIIIMLCHLSASLKAQVLYSEKIADLKETNHLIYPVLKALDQQGVSDTYTAIESSDALYSKLRSNAEVELTEKSLPNQLSGQTTVLKTDNYYFLNDNVESGSPNIYQYLTVVFDDKQNLFASVFNILTNAPYEGSGTSGFEDLSSFISDDFKSTLQSELSKSGKSTSDVFNYTEFISGKNKVIEAVVLLDPGSNDGSTPSRYGSFFVDGQGVFLGKSEYDVSACFPSEAKILLSDHSTISISEVKEGMNILSLDDNLNLTSSRVEALEVHEYCGQILEISLENEQSFFASNGTSIQREKTKLSVTPNHPILTDKGIVPAGALKNNDFVRVYNALSGSFNTYKVGSLNTKKANEKVYNIKTSSKFYLVDGVVVGVK